MNRPRHPSTPSPDPASTRVQQAAAALRLVIDAVRPSVDGGRFPAKGAVGTVLTIEATIFGDGHDVLAAEAIVHAPAGAPSRLAMRDLGNDRWQALYTPQGTGLHRFEITAWIDHWASYRRGLARLEAAKATADQDIADGIERIEAQLADKPDAALAALLDRVKAASRAGRVALLLGDEIAARMNALQTRHFATRSEREWPIRVERAAAGFGSWYELFPRSQSPSGEHGTFDDVIARLPAIAAMGFDVLYMPPIHPIGTTKRKGRNNSLVARQGDPGSPYAIGSAEGGHDAVHPALGGIEGLRRLQAAAAGYGIELALDIAIQCSPDHPWLREHPEWFAWRSDGTVRCAENPPKKYEDIVNVEFYAPQAVPGLWLAWRDVIEHWIGEGIRTFRVDNPHTKPLPFWEWLIAEIHARHPDVLFLSEAFTRPAMMYRLAKIGFSQSYTYFTWRNTKRELSEYITELTRTAPRDFFRPHFFVNTPDINPKFLHGCGRPGFLIRAALASTLSGLWGLYSGFELCESAPLKPDGEEYLDSEKYQLRLRDWTAPGNIVAEITRLNHLRREFPALQSHLGTRLLPADNEQILAYARQVPGDGTVILVIVSVDPHAAQETWLDLPREDLGIAEHGAIEAEELMSEQRFVWRDRRQHWRLVPQEMPFAIFRLRRAGASA